MKNLILVGASDWGLEVWAWLTEANDYGEKFIFKGFIDQNLDALNSIDYCDAKVIDTINNYEPQPNDVFVCTIVDIEIKEYVVNKLLLKGVHFINLIHNSVIFF
jgi:hypothetical protein